MYIYIYIYIYVYVYIYIYIYLVVTFSCSLAFLARAAPEGAIVCLLAECFPFLGF